MDFLVGFGIVDVTFVARGLGGALLGPGSSAAGHNRPTDRPITRDWGNLRQAGREEADGQVGRLSRAERQPRCMAGFAGERACVQRSSDGDRGMSERKERNEASFNEAGL